MRPRLLPALAILAMMLSLTTTACASMPNDGPAFSIEDISIPHSGYKVGCTFIPDDAQKKPASEASSKPELLKPTDKAPAVQEVPVVGGEERSMVPARHHSTRGGHRLSGRFRDRWTPTASHTQPGLRRGAEREWTRDNVKESAYRWRRGPERYEPRARFSALWKSPCARSGPSSA